MINVENQESLNNSKIAKAIRTLRVLRKMTQEEVADGVCQRTTLTNYENGNIKLPSVTILRGIADKFGMTLDELMIYAYSGSSEFNIYKKMRVQALMDEKRYDDALEICRSVLEVSGSATDMQMLLYVEGAYALNKREYEQAKQLLNDAMNVTKSPSRHEYFTLNELKIAHSILLNEIYHIEKSSMSKEEMIAALDILHASLDAFSYSSSPTTIIKIYAAVSDLYRYFGKDQDALVCIEKAYDITKKSANYDYLGIIFQAFAYIYLSEHRYEEAVSYYKKALQFYELVEHTNYIDALKRHLKLVSETNPELSSLLNF